MINEKNKIKANIKLTRVNNQTGEVLDTIELHNIIVTTGLELANDWFAGLAPTAPSHLAIGTGTTTEVIGDTALETENQRQAPTITEPSSVSTQYQHQFTFAGNFAITELGLLNAVTIGTLFNRATFPARNVTAVIDLIATVTITSS